MTLKLYVDPHPNLPDDEELMLITAYVCRSMSKEEMEAFEKRLDEDEHFFDRVEPILDAWVEPRLTPAEIEVREEMRAEGFFDQKPQRTARRSYYMYGGLAAAAAIVLAALTQLRVTETPKVGPAISAAPSPVHVAAATPKSVAKSSARIRQRPAAPAQAQVPAAVQIPASEEPGSLPALAKDLSTPRSRPGPSDFAVIAPAVPVAPVPEGAHVTITVTNETVQSAPTADGFWGKLRARLGAIFGRSELPGTDPRRPNTRRIVP